MRLIYNIGVQFYVALIYVTSIANSKAKSWILGRKNIFHKIKEQVNTEKNTAWFHVSSLGEFEQGKPVIEAFRSKYPNYQIILTFFSPSGYEIRKNYEGADAVFYLPTDSAKNAKRFIQLVKPKIAFFVKYEYWYHYLNELNKNKVPTYIFSAIFRKNQLFFKWYGSWYRKMLCNFELLFVQNQESLELLKSIGVTNVEVGGDTRFDRVYQISKESKEIIEIEQFCNGNKVIVAGSTWEKDEQILENYMRTLGDNIKLILAPHEIHPSNIQRIQKLFNEKCICFSEKESSLMKDAQVLIIDSIGLLSSLYRYGQVAFIGGGFGTGIHNTLEAATYGIPVVFGPKYHKFQEAKDLIKENAAFTIQNQEEFNTVLNNLLKNDLERQKYGDSALNYVNKMRGGTQLLLERIAI